MKVIHEVYFTENVAVLSFEKAPATIHFLSGLFTRVAKAGINVDMISQTAPKGSVNTLSFTVTDEPVPGVLAVLNEMNAGIRPMVSTGNVKIALYGEEMPSKVGVAAGAFALLNEAGIDILLITTSEVDISIVVTSANSDAAYAILKKEYMTE